MSKELSINIEVIIKTPIPKQVLKGTNAEGEVLYLVTYPQEEDK